MNFLKRTFPIVLPLALLASALPASAKDFTQADLEKMVADLDKVIPQNSGYKYPIKCSIEAKDSVNAYATYTKEGSDKRATMVVFSGLIKRMDGDQRLIRAVVAHELSHLSLGHSVDVNPAARDLNNLWNRQQEFEADKFGADCLIKGGYAGKDMVDMLLFLERQRSRQGDWLGRLTADHADPKARAARVSDSPSSLNALVLFDTGLAYSDARKNRFAKEMFDTAYAEWPALTVALINSAKSSLMFYYDSLPGATQQAWWRPDFGPLITNTGVSLPQGNDVTDEDRERWKDALDAAQKAKTANPSSEDAEEVLALAQVLEPDAKRDVVQKGIDWFKAHGASASDQIVKLRYANNAGVGYQRTGDLTSAYATIIAAQKLGTKFNYALGENLGLVRVTGRSKEDEKLASDVLYTWLTRVPKTSPRWATVKKTFDETCSAAGITPKELEEKPVYLCSVLSLFTSGKELALFMPQENYVSALGTPELRTTFTKRFPDMAEIRWHNGNIAIFTEGTKSAGIRVMRVTSYEPDAYLMLKPLDKTLTNDIKIKVGMSRAEVFAILGDKSGVPKELARAGKVESWTYWPDLQMGVMFDGDVVKAVTVTPVIIEEDE